MEFTAALAALKKLENGAELATAIESHVTALDGKVFAAAGDSRAKASKADSLEATVLAIAKSLGIEGETEAILTTLEPKITELKATQTKLTEAESRATAAETKVKGFETQTKLNDIAVKAGASAAVLQTLFGDKIDQFSIDGENVKFGDKLLREHVEADSVLKQFSASLFPNSQQQQQPAKTQPKLPSGTANGAAPAKDPVSATVSKMKFAIPGGQK